MLGWVKKKSAEHQAANASRSLIKLMTAADALDQVWAAKREPTPPQVAAFQGLKGEFCTDFIGPIPLEAIKCHLIDAVLSSPSVGDGSRVAVRHAYEYGLKQSWGGEECLRLQILMDYSDPIARDEGAEAFGTAAVRWSVLSDEFGNGLHAASALHVGQAILITLLYAEMLTFAPRGEAWDTEHTDNRLELFRRIQEAIGVCVKSDDWTELLLKAWNTPDGFPMWPWHIREWNEVEARRPHAFADWAPEQTLLKTYTATLWTGPATPLTPQGWTLTFQEPRDRNLSACLPAVPLVAMAAFMAGAKGDNRSMLPSLLRRVNLYYGSAGQTRRGMEAMAVRAALQTILNSRGPDISDYRRQDDTVWEAYQPILSAVVPDLSGPAGGSDSPLDRLERHLADWLRGN